MGNVKVWFTKLAPGSILSLKQLKDAFLIQLCGTMKYKRPTGVLATIK